LDNSTTSSEKSFAGKLLPRLGLLGSQFRFARQRSGSLRSCLRLFYYTAIKPSLAFRGWARFSPEKILSFNMKVPGQGTFQVYARDNGLEVVTIEEFFSPHWKLVPPNLPPLQPRVVYDLGANVGISSLFFAALYPGATVYGFEPLPRNYEVCSMNYRNLPKGRLFPWAIGSRTGMAVFECQNDPRGGRLESSSHDLRHLPTTKRIEVEVVSVDDLVRIKGLEPPDFLKIDVEGAELDVLNGLGEQSRGIRRIFVETHGPELKRECLKWMKDRGYKIWDSEYETAIWADRV
jgi:FkbM family methyltransferase